MGVKIHDNMSYSEYVLACKKIGIKPLKKEEFLKLQEKGAIWC